MPHPYLPRSTRKTLLHSRRTSSSVHLHKTILFHNHCWFVRLGGRSRPCILRRRTHTSSYRHRHQHLSLDHNDTLQFASLSKQTKESLVQQYLWQISWRSPVIPLFNVLSKGDSSQWSWVQIFGHACKYPTCCLPPDGVFNPVMFYLDYLFLVVWVECL